MGIAFRTGNGLRVKIGKNEIREIQEEVRIIAGDAFLGVYNKTGRALADEIRFCKWDGQSPTGRKLRENLNQEPFPFEGCSDARVPLVDMLIQERVDLVCNATQVGLSGPGVMGITGLDSEQAGLLDDLLTWEFRNGIGSAWRTDLERLANYVFGDTPGIGVMKVYWVQKMVTAAQRLTVAQVAEMLDEVESPAPAMNGSASAGVPATARLAAGNGGSGMFFARAVEEKRTEEVAAILGAMLDEVVTEKAELVRMAMELEKDGETAFPMAFMGENHAAVRALRPYEDVFWRGSARTIQEARIVLEREWLSIGECLERAEVEGWDEEFTQKLLGKKGGQGDEAGAGMYGVTMFPSHEKDPGTVLDTTWQVKQEAYADQVEIVTCYFRGTNARGIEGVYYTTLNAGIEFAAHDGEPIGYDHGKYPFVDVQAEYLRDNACDSRGESDKTGSHQQQLKLQVDMRLDRTQLNTVPPMTGPMWLAGQKFTVEPGGYIEQPRMGMLQWMPMTGSGAAESDGALQNLWLFVNHYAKRQVGDVPQDLVLTAKQAVVGKWLEKMAEVVRMVGQLAMQFHTDEEIMEICDVEENPFPRDVVSNRNLFHVQLFVDVGDLDREMLLKKAEMFFKYVLPLDTEGEIDRGRLRDVLMARIDPALSRVARRKASESIGAEQAMEKDAFAKIAAGVEGEYLEGDHNYMARLRQLDQLMEENREDIGRNWTPRKQDLLRKRRENLAFGLQQQENAVTGRRGVQEGSAVQG